MSSIIFIASDHPLPALPNPHDCAAVPDRSVIFNVDNGIIEDGDFDDDFAVIPTEKTVDMRTDKMYCAYFEMVRFTKGRAKLFIEYLKEQLKNSSEIELWHSWLDGSPLHDVRKIETTIFIEDLKPEDIEKLEKHITLKDPLIIDYCCKISCNF